MELSFDAAAVIAVLVLVLALLVTEWIPPGITGLVAIVLLPLLGVMQPAAALSGLVNGAVVTVACMYVISAGISRTGATGVVANLIIGRESAEPGRAYVLLLAATMVLSAFMNNTPLVLLFMPLVLGLSERMNEPPSRLLIPLSFVSILGGMCTLIGTSTNLVVASSVAEVSGGRLELAVFDFARLGVVLGVGGFFLVILLRRRLLPARPSLGILTRHGVALEFVTELEVRGDSPLAGRALKEVREEALLGEGIRLLEVVRGEVIRLPAAEIRLQPGDLLLVKGEPDAILGLRLREEKRGAAKGRDTVRGVALTLFEAVVTPDSPWSGRSIAELALRDRYGISVFAIQRHGAHLREKIDRLPLHAGDVLLVQGSEDALRKVRSSEAALVVEGVERAVRHTRRAPVAALALLLFVALAVTRLLPVEMAALLAALVMVVTGCLSAREAYAAIGWDVLFLVGGSLALGRAIESTGLAADTAHAVVGVAGAYGPRAVLAVVLLFTALLTQILSNNAAAAIMTPLAYQMGLAFGGASPLPFVMAVAFGANCSFLTPVSYKTNLLIYGPGGYRFTDFLRPGMPLFVLFLVLATLLLPVLY